METSDWVDGDPVLYFLLGRKSPHLNFSAAVGLSFVLCLVVSALVAAQAIGGAVAVVAMGVVVGAVSWWAVPPVSIVVALIAALFTNGFVYDSQGTLAWHGDSDLWTLGALAVLACLLDSGTLAKRVLEGQVDEAGVCETARVAHVLGRRMTMTDVIAIGVIVVLTAIVFGVSRGLERL